jgi:hypothetical protein
MNNYIREKGGRGRRTNDWEERRERKVEGKGAIDGWIKGAGASAVFRECTV